MTPGLARLMDELVATPLPGLVDDLWRLISTRGHVDIDRARPFLDRDHAGILVYARPLDALRALVIVETGDRLVGAAGAFGALPRLGSAVRLAPAPGGGSAWRLIVDEAFPPVAAVRFDRVPSGAEGRRWIAAMRDALDAIRAAEAVRREGIAAQRREFPALVPVRACDDVVRERVDALRGEVERETDYTADEAAELHAARSARTGGTYAEQRRAFERETALVRARQERFDARMRTVLDAFRAELPGLRRRIRATQLANQATRAGLQRLENAYGDSRARTQATFVASARLDALAGAPFVVTGASAAPGGLDDPAHANEVLRAIALLARAIPRAGARIAV